MRRVLFVSLPLLFAAVLSAGFLLYSPTSDATPTVRWGPLSLYQSLVAGQSTTVTATFTATANAQNVNLWVVPALTPYVSVSPTTFATVKKGMSYPVAVTTSAPVDMAVGSYDGTIHLRVGKKTLSTPLSVNLTFSPIPLPPDPGEAGKLTIEGIDSDSDGVRDDVQRWIGFNAYTSESGHAALMQNARAMQTLLVADTDEEIIATAHALADAGHCLYFVRGGNHDAAPLISYLRAEMLNTRERSLKYITAQPALNGQIFSSDIATWQYKCAFDPLEMDT